MRQFVCKVTKDEMLFWMWLNGTQDPGSLEDHIDVMIVAKNILKNKNVINKFCDLEFNLDISDFPTIKTDYFDKYSCAKMKEIVLF